MSDDAIDRVPVLVERLFAILLDCRTVVRRLEPGAPREESSSAAAERLLYYALVGAMEEGLVQTAGHVLTVLRHANVRSGRSARSG